MKPLLALVLFAAALPAAETQPITVTGDAEIKVAPDQVELALGVEVHAKTLDEARRENDRRVRGVRAAMARLGVADQDVQTDFIQMSIAYENDGITPRYFNTQKSIVIVLRDVEKMEAALKTFHGAGHFPYLCRPEEYSGLVTEFLSV